MKNESAFPIEAHPGATHNSASNRQFGLTKREYFAAMAMQGELASQSEEAGQYVSDVPNARALAKRCVLFADALIEELVRK